MPIATPLARLGAALGQHRGDHGSRGVARESLSLVVPMIVRVAEIECARAPRLEDGEQVEVWDGVPPADLLHDTAEALRRVVHEPPGEIAMRKEEIGGEVDRRWLEGREPLATH